MAEPKDPHAEALARTRPKPAAPPPQPMPANVQSPLEWATQDETLLTVDPKEDDPRLPSRPMQYQSNELKRLSDESARRRALADRWHLGWLFGPMFDKYDAQLRQDQEAAFRQEWEGFNAYEQNRTRKDRPPANPDIPEENENHII